MVQPRPEALTTALLCLIITLSLLCTTPSFTGADEEAVSAYDVLRSYGFPEGLLPKGVTGYELDRSTGQFSAHLGRSCSFTISGYQLKYKPTITGRMSQGRLSKLKGVTVKVLLLWVNIVEVVRSEDELEFSVGIASADFPLDNFEESPSCGCGFNCGSSSEKVGSSNLFVSSLLDDEDDEVGF